MRSDASEWGPRASDGSGREQRRAGGMERKETGRAEKESWAEMEIGSVRVNRRVWFLFKMGFGVQIKSKLDYLNSSKCNKQNKINHDECLYAVLEMFLEKYYVLKAKSIS